MKNTLLRINDTLYRACIGIAGLSVLIMTLIIPWGI
ncbi:TRAP transporter small permease, partial [Pseudomonas syringae pv. actinidiae]|nr:TRAP transporter small permease [Pseudomonas syringae pv. actinidiae]